MERKRRPRGEGSIRFRPDKKLWAGTFDLGKDFEGKRQRRTIYAKTRPELMRRIADLRARSGGTIRRRAVGTVGEFVDAWLRDDVKPNRSANTYALYESMWRVHAAPIVAARSLEKFDVDDVPALYRSLRDRGASPSVVHRVSVVLQRAFSVAVRRRAYTKANPFTLVERPTYRAKEARSLTAAEARALIAAAHEDRFEALWLLALTAGLRLGELLGLQWSDIEWARRAVSVTHALIEVDGRVELAAPKTAGSRRLVDIGRMAERALLRRRSAADAEAHGSPFVFSTLDGTPMRRSNLRRSNFTPLLKRAGLKDLRIHDLRHSMTSLAAAEGVNLKVLAERLGHSTTRLTQDRYSHVLPGLQRSAADAIDALLEGPPRGG